ncbi:hypothetical protein [Novosphingopyxis sp.]|uniref:hypothetical protein n=1 Tax=Novosphingopyxis sp. TaxID=2709690 RepID=UPI003B5CCFDF
MSALLRGLESGAVLAFSPQRASAAASSAALSPSLQPSSEAELLQRRIADLEAALVTAAGEKDAAYAKGVQKGGAAADEATGRHIAAVADGISQALQAQQGALEELSLAAPRLAGAALARLFEPDAGMTALVEAALARQLADLDEDLLLRVRLSGEDFADDGALDALRQRFEGLAIEIRTELPSGACHFDMKLGRIDASPTVQWARLSELLETLGTRG